MVDEPARRFGEEKDQRGQEEGWQNLETEANPPLSAVVIFEGDVCAVGDPCCDEVTHSKHELLKGCDSSSDTRMCKFSLVEWDDHD